MVFVPFVASIVPQMEGLGKRCWKGFTIEVFDVFPLCSEGRIKRSSYSVAKRRDEILFCIKSNIHNVAPAIEHGG